MKYVSIYTDVANGYSIGINDETGEYLIAVLMGGIGQYLMYFKLRADEVEEFRKDQNALKRLAQELFRDKGKKFFRDREIVK